MKTSLNFPALVVLLSTLFAASAEERVAFRAHLNGASAVPPNDSEDAGEALLILSGNELAGVAGTLNPEFPAAAGRIENGVGIVLFETTRFQTGVPMPEDELHLSLEFAVIANLSDDEIAQLKNGDLFVSIASTRYPAGEIRGKLVQIPDPANKPRFPDEASIWRDVLAIEGERVTLSDFATGTPVPVFQWIFIGTNLNSPGTNIIGATSTNFTIPKMSVEHAGVYRLTATNEAGSSGTLWQVHYYPSGAAKLDNPRLTGKGFEFGVNGVPRRDYVVQGSTDLESWIPLATNEAVFHFRETNALARPLRFFRAEFAK